MKNLLHCLWAILLLLVLRVGANAQAPGTALTFNSASSQYVNVNTTLGNFGTSDFTIEAWFRTTSASIQSLISKRAICAISNFWNVNMSGGQLIWEIDGGNSATYTSITTPASYNDGHWHHVAVTKNSSAIAIYVDDVLAVSGALNGNPNLNNTNSFLIGNILCSGNVINGSIDEVRLYNAALTPANIAADMTSTSASVPGNLQAYYNFDEGTGTVLNDITGNGNTGTLINGPTWSESYAMVVPTVAAATNITATGFSANWTAPAVGTVNNYLLDVSANSTFTSPVTGSPFTIASPAVTQAITGLTGNTTYYYRVSADKTSVTGQGDYSATATALVLPAITSFTPASGAIGTVITITGTNLNSPTAFSIGGQPAIVVSNTGSKLVAMVMPGAVTGTISITTANGTGVSGSNFTVTPTLHPNVQQGGKLTGSDATGAANQGNSVAVSADGNTAIVGAPSDASLHGAATIYVKNAGLWTQQGSKLFGSGGIGAAQQGGGSVALSADGNTAIVGGLYDNNTVGAAWIYTRNNSGTWTQQGNKLVGTGNTGAAFQGYAVTLSADGNTAIVGGLQDNGFKGAVWVYTRSAGTWTQQGSKLLPSDETGNGAFGYGVSLSADGNTLLIGALGDNSGVGAAWIFTRSGNTFTQLGNKLVPSDIVGSANFGNRVAINANGTSVIVGGPNDNTGAGAAWVYTYNAGTWSQQGNKLVGSGAAGAANQGQSVAITADGNTAMVGATSDNNHVGTAWIFTRSGTTWTQTGSKLTGTGYIAPTEQGDGVALSADGGTGFMGAAADNSNIGASWAFTSDPANASLLSLTTTAGTISPVFATATTTYTASVANAVTSVTVSPATVSSTATIQVRVNGGTYATVASGGTSLALSLNAGANTIDIKVTAEDGSTTQTYTITVTRAATTPTVTTATASSITSTTAILGGNVTDDGGATVIDRGIVYSTSANPTTADTKVAIGNNTGAFSQTVTGLAITTTYHVRAYAINSVGTSYGSDQSFTTLAVVATESTGAVSTFTATTATFTGTISSDGGSAITENGVVYSTSANPTTSDTKIVNGTGIGSVSVNASGLVAGTTYHIRTYAINGIGTSYGSDVSFITATPTISTTGTLSALSTTSGTASASGTFNVSGTSIITGILVTPPAGFEVSLDNSVFASTVTISGNGAIASTPIYVRLAAADAVNTYSGNIALTGTSATVVDVATVTSTVYTQTTVINVTSATANGSYKAGTSISIQVTFSDLVDVTGTPALTLNSGGTASYTSGTGTNTLTFIYTVASGENTGDLDYTATTALSGTIKDHTNNLAATLTLSSPGSTGSLGFNKDINIDTQAPGAPTITDLYPNDDSGSSNTDKITNVTTPRIDGQGNPNISVVLFDTDGVTQIGTAGTNNGGFWQVMVTTALSNGSHTITAQSVDAAGNYSPASNGLTLTIDTQAPTVTSVSIVSNNSNTANAITGNQATISFTTSEAVTTPIVIIDSKTATVTNTSGNNYTATYTFTGTDTEGTVPFNISVTDIAGNNTIKTTTDDASSLLFDRTTPTLISVAIASNNSNTSKAKTGDIVTVSFTSSETIATPTVTIDAQAATVANTSGNNWTATYTMTGTDAEGTVPFSITFSDIAGNAGTAVTATTNSSSVVFDRTVPTLTSVAIASNNSNTSKAKTSDQITISFTSSETISTPTVTIDSQTATVANTSGNNWTATYTMTGTDAEGIIPFNIAFADIAGNAGTAVTATTNSSTVVFDRTTPTLTSVSIASNNTNTTKAKTGDIVTLSFTSSETINPPTVTVDSQTATVSNTSGNNWTATYTMANTDAEGTIPFSITFADIAGNAGTSVTATTNSSSVVFDRTVPTLTSVAIASNNSNTSQAKTGDIVTVLFTSSETISTPTVTVDAQAATVSNTSGNNWTATYTMTGADAEGIIPFSITFADIAGNAGTSVTATSNSSSVLFDRSAPATPVGLVAVHGDQQVVLNWTANTEPDLLSYNIYQGTTTNPTTLLTTITAGTTTYTNTGLINGTTYYYRISAVDNAGNESPLSTSISSTPKGPQTITFNALTPVTYGDSPVTLTGTASSGLPVSYTSSNTAVATVSGNVVTIIGAGMTNITASQAGDGTYEAATNVLQSLIVSAKTITITADAQTKTYGDADPTLTYTFSPAPISGDSFTGVLSRTTGENIGAYAINQNTLALSSNYALTYNTANLAIGTKTIAVTVDVKSKTYGDVDPTLTYTFSPALISGDSFTGSLARTTGENIGTYAINQNTLALSSNYALTYNTANLTIGTKAVTITADAQTKIYGDTDPALTYTNTALVGSDTFTGSLTRPAGENVGTYAISQGTLALNNNYALTYAGANLTINTATATLALSNLSQVYDGTAKTATVTTTPVGLGTISITYDGNAIAPSVAGTYAVVAGLSNINYTAANATGNLVIGPAAQAINFGPLTAKIYGDASFSLTATGGTSSNVITYLSSNPAVATISGSTVTIVGAGSANITASQAGSANYNAAADVIQQLTVGKAAITIAANAASKTYGDTDPPLTYSVTSGALVGSDACTGTLARTPGESAATYAINLGTVALNGNYTLTYTTADFIIGKAALTITADNQTMAYGAALPTLTASYSGFVNGENSLSLTVQPTLSTSATTTSLPGSYPITVSGAVAANYAVTYAAGTLTVTPLAIATLSGLSASGLIFTPTFSAATTSFTASVLNTVSSTTITPVATDATATITVNGMAIASGTVSAPIQLAVGLNTITTIVTAQDGVSKQTYTITITRASDGVATLNGLAVSTGTLSPAFATDITNYTVTVPNAISSMALTPTTTDPLSTVNVNGVTVTSGAASQPIVLAVGNNTITTVVTAVNGTRLAYTITVNRAASSAATLSNLVTNTGALTPVFAAATTNYALTVSNTISTITLTPTVTDATATVAVNGVTVASGNASQVITLPFGHSTITTVVTAQDGTTQTYTVIVNRPALTNANLSNLTISAGTLSPVFATGTNNYTVSVPVEVNTITLTPTYDATASATIYGSSVPNGLPSNSLLLITGNTIIPVIVTAQDGVTQNTYTVTVNRDNPAAPVQAMNILSPNGDGVNDYWVVKDIELYPNNTVTIYDRGGRVVYTKKGYTNDWSGTVNNAPLVQGTYFYVIDLGNQLPVIRGYITILRSR